MRDDVIVIIQFNLRIAVSDNFSNFFRKIVVIKYSSKSKNDAKKIKSIILKEPSSLFISNSVVIIKYLFEGFDLYFFFFDFFFVESFPDGYILKLHPQFVLNTSKNKKLRKHLSYTLYLIQSEVLSENNKI